MEAFDLVILLYSTFPSLSVSLGVLRPQFTHWAHSHVPGLLLCQ